MRVHLALLTAAALSACGARGVDTSLAPAASEPATVWGEYRASSENARAQLGDMTVERAGLLFSKGAVLYTRTLDPRRGGELVSAQGDSYAAIALGPADLNVELRRVTDLSQPADQPKLCGDVAPVYVALVHDARAVQVAVLVFSGEEPPGPRATASSLCGAFGYVAPDGARTRQGLVLR